jgi:hypothetical protein
LIASGRANDWSPRGSLGYFMGYRKNGAGYVIYVPKLEKFIELLLFSS